MCLRPSVKHNEDVSLSLPDSFCFFVFIENELRRRMGKSNCPRDEARDATGIWNLESSLKSRLHRYINRWPN